MWKVYLTALFGHGKVSMDSMVFLWDVLGHGTDTDIQGQIRIQDIASTSKPHVIGRSKIMISV